MKKNFKEQLDDIKAFAFDCDGVFTDGSLLMLTNGEVLRTYNAKDGFAVTLAIKRGYPIAIISGGVGEAMRMRFEKLGAKDIYLGCGDKMAALHEFAQKYNLSLENIAFMGDDIPDVEPMTAVGVPVSPCDAAPEVKDVSRYVSNFAGGRGCVRDIIEQVLKAQGNWAHIGSEKDIFSR